MGELASNSSETCSNATLYSSLPRKESFGAISMKMSSKEVEPISMEDSVGSFTTDSLAKDNDDDDDGHTPTPVRDASSTKRRNLLGMFAFLGVLAIFDAVFWCVLRGRKSATSPEESRTSRPFTFTSTRQWILDHAPLSTERSLLVSTSPQSKALAWVLKAAPDADPDKILTRFALATLLYATGQEVPQDECTVLNACDPDGVYTRLDLSYRGMSGELPPEVALMSNQLTYLDVSYNKLLGTIPSELGLLTKLVELNLNNNGFQGTIPSQLGLLTHMTKLEFVKLSGISGTIPDELAKLVELQSFVLISTNVTGPLPRWIGKWVNCSVVQLHKNPQLHGSLPTELALLKKLSDFTVGENNLLTGEIPTGLWTLEHLKSLTVDASSMNGTIATQIGHALQTLRLNMELLSGTIPTVLGELSNLETLSLRSPLLYGQLPYQLSMCRKLVSLTITHTELSQTLPTQLGMLESLEVLMLQGNHWTGTLPSEWATLANLTFLSVEDNELTGPIPTLQGLEVLHLGFNNGFSGTVASCFGGDVIVDCQDVVCNCCRCTDVVV